MLDQKREIINLIEMCPKKNSNEFIKDFISAIFRVKFKIT